MSNIGSANDTIPLPDEHAKLLATKWWSRDQFRQNGVLCREGEFTLAESESVQDVIRQYQTAQGISDEDVEDLILGTTKLNGFWETIGAV
ncbi:hypothetical protein EI94DRAFT_1807600 [Lactarius quietus]|nr:hypothetical protein EI94DRAFT_1807600 [Lactarius quietus]